MFLYIYQNVQTFEFLLQFRYRGWIGKSLLALRVVSSFFVATCLNLSSRFFWSPLRSGAFDHMTEWGNIISSHRHSKSCTTSYLLSSHEGYYWSTVLIYFVQKHKHNQRSIWNMQLWRILLIQKRILEITIWLFQVSKLFSNLHNSSKENKYLCCIVSKLMGCKIIFQGHTRYAHAHGSSIL